MTATLFPFKPILPYTQALEWITNVLTSWDGHEQRIRLRHAPRNELSLRIVSTEEALSARIRAFLALYQSSLIGIPAWHDSIETLGIGSGETIISVDTTESEFYEGSYAVIWEDDETCEFLEIDTVDDDQIVLVSPTTQSYATGTLIIPMHESYLEENLSYDDINGERSIFNLKFRCVNEEVLATDHWSSQIYLGSRVMDDPILLSSSSTVPRMLKRPLVMVDYGVGAVEVFDKTDFSFLEGSDYRWVLNSRSDIWKFRQWLSYMSGQMGTVWIPTKMKDVNLTGGFNAGDTQLYITPYGYSENELFAHLAFIKTDGTILCRAVDSWTANTVTIDSGLGFTGSMADFDRISFLRLYRFTTDRVELNWHTKTRIETTIPIKTVYDEESP